MHCKLMNLMLKYRAKTFNGNESVPCHCFWACHRGKYSHLSSVLKAQGSFACRRCSVSILDLPPTLFTFWIVESERLIRLFVPDLYGPSSFSRKRTLKAMETHNSPLNLLITTSWKQMEWQLCLSFFLPYHACFYNTPLTLLLSTE